MFDKNMHAQNDSEWLNQQKCAKIAKIRHIFISRTADRRRRNSCSFEAEHALYYRKPDF